MRGKIYLLDEDSLILSFMNRGEKFTVLAYVFGASVAFGFLFCLGFSWAILENAGCINHYSCGCGCSLPSFSFTGYCIQLVWFLAASDLAILYTALNIAVWLFGIIYDHISADEGDD